MPPTYAVLGATGTVGNILLTHLFTTTSIHINAFIRSQAKLDVLSPDIVTSPRLTTYVGDITHSLAPLTDCLRSTTAAFLCCACSNNNPATTIAQDQARAVIAALNRIRADDPTAIVPRLIVLDSAETEARFCSNIPWLFQQVLFRANCFIYADLIAAAAILRKEEGWVDMIFVKSGGLSHDAPEGHRVSGEGPQQTWLSFGDLAAGMVECACKVEGRRWVGSSVTVVGRSGRGVGVEWRALGVLARGLLVSVVPALYDWLF